jgi:drug/metabolite transporter (DMT)-like permease
MKQLNKAQSIVFLLGGLLMVVGAGMYAFLIEQKISSVLFLAGAIAFSLMQIYQRYEGQNLTIRRLRKIMLAADVCFVLAGMLMTEQQYGLMSYVIRGEAYIQFVIATYNKWVVILLIAAILEMYTMHRISNELEKEKENTEKNIKD